MVTVPSVTFGNIEIDEKKIYSFKKEIPGVRNISRYALLDFEEGTPFKWLQACQEPYLSLLAIDAAFVKSDYEVKLNTADQEALEIESPDDIYMMALVVVPDDPKQMTANLLAPIILNFKKMLGLQVVNEGADADLLRVKVLKD